MGNSQSTPETIGALCGGKGHRSLGVGDFSLSSLFSSSPKPFQLQLPMETAYTQDYRHFEQHVAKLLHGAGWVVEPVQKIILVAI